MVLTIEEFWKRVLPRRALDHQSTGELRVPGWSTNPKTEIEGEFIEAPLKEGSQTQTRPIGQRSVLLVSAPGAVGKTTLAKQICAQTGSVYIDLADAGTVGADTLGGGLYRAGLHELWEEGQLGLVVDALDEARMRVTEASFLDFLSEIVRLTLSELTPEGRRIVLFGRTGVIDDARFWLEASGLASEDVGILEIEFYGAEQSETFAQSVLRAIRSRRQHPSPGKVEYEAIGLILQKLRQQTDAEGQRFAGYAPVLRAVAERVADETGNVMRFINELTTKPVFPITLEGIADEILKRDQGKVSKLSIRPQLLDQLYTPQEQLDRLSAELYGTRLPTLPANMTPGEIEAYKTALDTWMQEHPFLDGKGRASCAVFEAYVCVHALRRHGSGAALSGQLKLGRKANPFLLELYRGAVETVQESFPSEHVGILYASVRSRLVQGEWASLDISESEDGKSSELVEFDITIGQGNREFLLHEGAMSVETPIKFGPDLEDVSIDALSSLEVELGCDSTYVNVVTPVSIACKSLLIHARHMSVVAGQHAYFRASEFVSNVQSPPRVHGDATLGVDWNWSEYPYPWTHYEAKASAPGGLDRDSEEILRRLRKFVVVCKAGLDGRLGRHARKFENNRMLRGWGRSVLARLLERRVFQKDGQMYHLDPTRLSTVTGLTYDGCRKGEYTGASLEFAAEVGGEG